MDGYTITDGEFQRFRDWLRRAAGIHLAPAKKALVCSRLAKRLKHHGLASYGDYFRLLTGGEHADELQTALDLLTTNETYFFREAKHFDFLREQARARPAGSGPFRVWSAACSSGEEPYTVAMVLAESLGEAPWEVVASDISTQVLARARIGHYPLERGRNIPPEHLRKHCLKGVGARAGTFLVDRPLRTRVQFRQINLNAPLPELGSFDSIFLRNVMIYFDPETKRQVVTRLVPCLKPGGHFIIGHSETLNGVVDAGLTMLHPSIYRKEAT